MAPPKGVSGNPLGLSKRQHRLREIAQEVASQYLEEAIGVHAAVMRDVEAPHAARVSAASAIIERAAGKAVAVQEHTGEVEHRFVVETPAVPASVDDWQKQNAGRLLS